MRMRLFCFVPDQNAMMSDKMKTPPMNFLQAARLGARFRHLEGNPFGSDCEAASQSVRWVVVAPYHAAERSRFLRYLLRTKSPVEALSFYRGPEYCVLVVACADRTNIHYHELSVYLKEQGLETEPLRYGSSASTTVI
jgi:hypothetical protein